MKNMYLFLAIVGAIVPCIFFVQHFQQFGVDLIFFVQSLFTNPAASGFTTDLLLTTLAFRVAISARRIKEDGPSPLWFIILNLAIGRIRALPACLYCNERKKEAGADWA